MLAVLKKELKNYFLTPLGYIFIGIFMLVYSFIFYMYTFNYGSLFFSYVFYDSAVILTFLSAFLTINMFAGERRSGTDQLLFTSPKSTIGIVIGKFLAAMTVIIVTEMLSAIYLGIICYFGTPELSAILPTLLGLLLLSMAYISFGMLASSLTDNPIIAYLITSAFLFLTMYITNFSEIFSVISFLELFFKFVEGVISIEATVALLSFTVLCIVLTIISIQRRKNVK